MKKQNAVSELTEMCFGTKIRADKVNDYLNTVGSTPLSESKHLSDLVSRPELSLSKLLDFVPRGTKSDYSSDEITAAEVSIKYAGYIEREKLQAEKNNRLEYIRIPADFDFDNLQGLTIECRQKLKKYKPETIAQASRISGVSPADISVLLVYFGR
jgi:tRNA uridine 5-carboxymethylaminomethyl modification enzyme